MFLRVTTRVITTYLSALMIHLSCFMNSGLIGFPIIFVLDLGPQAGLLCIDTILISRESRYCREQQTAYSFRFCVIISTILSRTFAQLSTMVSNIMKVCAVYDAVPHAVAGKPLVRTPFTTTNGRSRFQKKKSNRLF